MRWTTAFAALLVVTALLTSFGWFAYEWWIDVETRYPGDDRNPIEALVALSCLQAPALAGLLVALVDAARQRRDGESVSALTFAVAGLSLAVTVVIAVQSVILWFFEPFHRIVIGRPLPGAPPPQAPAGWAWDAQMEHQAQAAFLELADDLEFHRAPADLVRACLLAADQEALHARESAALAGMELGALPAAPRSRPGRSRIAWESVVHGVIGEARAVAVAHRRLERAMSARERALLARIIEDERSHALLGARVAAWACFGVSARSPTPAGIAARRTPAPPVAPTGGR